MDHTQPSGTNGTNHGAVRVLTYNVHGCVGTDGFRSYTRVAEVIAKSRADVVALQELDVGRIRSGKTHQVQVIADILRMEFHFHPALRIREEEYGDAILSRYPMTLIKSGALPGGRPSVLQEPRGALWVSIQAEGRTWHVMNTHFGLGRLERFRQAQAIAGPEWIAAAPATDHIIFCGDLNSRPQSRVHRVLRDVLDDACFKAGSPHRSTFPTRWPAICLDYIFVSKGIGVNDVRILRDETSRSASDHYPLIADLAALTCGQPECRQGPIQ